MYAVCLRTRLLEPVCTGRRPQPMNGEAPGEPARYLPLVSVLRLGEPAAQAVEFLMGQPFPFKGDGHGRDVQRWTSLETGPSVNSRFIPSYCPHTTVYILTVCKCTQLSMQCICM